MTAPTDPRAHAALEALDERLATEGVIMRVWVGGGLVAALAYDPDEDPIDIAAAADRGDRLLADIAHEHRLPADWLQQLDPRPAPPPPARRPRGILGWLRGLTKGRR